jgi:predicted acylesterase/phospholipase RssA
MTIKHLVLSGGGPTMVQTLGSIQHLEEKGFIKRSDIESIYGTSAGMLVGTLLCLQFDWETINDYIIKRPWQDVFKIQVQDIFNAYTKRGIFDIGILEKCLKPLLDAKDISLAVTLEEFYQYSKIDMHFFTFEVNDFELIDISHTTHPNLLLSQAILMTCSIPVLITPFLYEEKCYIDGGIVCNYPVKYCVESGKNVDEILGFKNNYQTDKKNIVDNNSTMLDFILSILFKSIYSLGRKHAEPPIKYQVVCDTEFLTFQFLRTSLSCVETRKELLQSGIQFAEQFLSTLENGI